MSKHLSYFRPVNLIFGFKKGRYTYNGSRIANSDNAILFFIPFNKSYPSIHYAFVVLKLTLNRHTPTLSIFQNVKYN